MIAHGFTVGDMKKNSRSPGTTQNRNSNTNCGFVRIERWRSPKVGDKGGAPPVKLMYSLESKGWATRRSRMLL